MASAISNLTLARKYGLIAGIIISAVTFLQYLGGTKWFNSPISNIIYFVPMIFAVLAVLKIRRENEGFLEFGEALKVTFTVFALGLLIQTIFSYVLFNIIDTSFRDIVRSQERISGKLFLEKTNLSQPEIEERMKGQTTYDEFSIRGIALLFALRCMASFAFCLLISVIVKKSKPTFNNI
jgi:hypothetical protein